MSEKINESIFLLPRRMTVNLAKKFNENDSVTTTLWRFEVCEARAAVAERRSDVEGMVIDYIRGHNHSTPTTSLRCGGFECCGRNGTLHGLEGRLHGVQKSFRSKKLF
jgi:hypothetical protein